MAEIAVKVNFLGELRSIAKRRDVQISLVQGTTVAQLLETLCELLGDRFARHLYGETATLHPSVSLFINGTDIKELAGVDTQLLDGEVDVLVLPIYSGG